MEHYNTNITQNLQAFYFFASYVYCDKYTYFGPHSIEIINFNGVWIGLKLQLK